MLKPHPSKRIYSDRSSTPTERGEKRSISTSDVDDLINRSQTCTSDEHYSASGVQLSEHKPSVNVSGNTPTLRRRAVTPSSALSIRSASHAWALQLARGSLDNRQIGTVLQSDSSGNSDEHNHNTHWRSSNVSSAKHEYFKFSKTSTASGSKVRKDNATNRWQWPSPDPFEESTFSMEGVASFNQLRKFRIPSVVLTPITGPQQILIGKQSYGNFLDVPNREMGKKRAPSNTSRGMTTSDQSINTIGYEECCETEQMTQHPVTIYEDSRYSMPRHRDHMNEATIHHKHVLGDRPPQTQSSRYKETACLALACFAAGMSFAVLGPTLLSIENRLDIGTSDAAILLTCRALGGIIGVILVGAIFERYNQHLTLMMSLGLAGMFTMLVPYCTSYLAMIAVVSCKGLFIGFVDCASGVMCLYIWGPQAAPYITMVQFSYGIGAATAPLIVSPFLAEHIKINDGATTQNPHTTISNYENDLTTSAWISSPEPLITPAISVKGKAQQNQNSKKETSTVNTAVGHVPANVPNPPVLIPMPPRVGASLDSASRVLIADEDELWQFHNAYIIVGCVTVLAALSFFGLAITRRFPLKIHKEARREKKKDWGKQKKNGSWFALVTCVCIFIFIHEGLEITYQNLLFTYAVAIHGWHAQTAAYLNSTFWFVHTIFRLIGTVAINFASVSIILIASIVVMVTAYAIELAYSDIYPWMLWITTFSIAVGMSSVVTSAITWLENRIEVSVRLSCLMMIVSSLGTEGLPALTGHLMENRGNSSFDALQLAAAAINAAILCGMLNLGHHAKKITAPKPKKVLNVLDVTYNVAKMEERARRSMGMGQGVYTSSRDVENRVNIINKPKIQVHRAPLEDRANNGGVLEECRVESMPVTDNLLSSQSLRSSAVHKGKGDGCSNIPFMDTTRTNSCLTQYSGNGESFSIDDDFGCIRMNRATNDEDYSTPFIPIKDIEDPETPKIFRTSSIIEDKKNKGGGVLLEKFLDRNSENKSAPLPVSGGSMYRDVMDGIRHLGNVPPGFSNGTSNLSALLSNKSNHSLLGGSTNAEAGSDAASLSSDFSWPTFPPSMSILSPLENIRDNLSRNSIIEM